MTERPSEETAHFYEPLSKTLSAVLPLHLADFELAWITDHSYHPFPQSVCSWSNHLENIGPTASCEKRSLA